jgi:hypothetical protein
LRKSDLWNFKDVVLLRSYQEAETDFVADNQGLTPLRRHQQLHMDFGLITLFDYVRKDASAGSKLGVVRHRVFPGSFQRLRSTTATLFTPLHARYRRRSGVATMLRTTPPPDGICFVLKLSNLGSNFTRVLGFTPDSLYQTSPSVVTAIPYICDASIFPAITDKTTTMPIVAFAMRTCDYMLENFKKGVHKRA